MKINNLFWALIMGLAVMACQPKGEQTEQAAEGDEATSEVIPREKTAKDYLPSSKERKDVSYLVGVNFGSFIKGYNFGDLDMAQIRKGIEDFLNAKQTSDPEEFAKQFRVDPNEMNELFNTYLENRRNYVVLSNKEREEKFFSTNLKKPGVVAAAEGFQYKIISEGNELKPAVSDTIWVKYKGTLLDGTVFDETPADSEARQFVLGRVIEAWNLALPLIGEGGEMELYVPYNMAYGENGTRGIGPAETLIFNISLEKVGKVAPKE